MQVLYNTSPVSFQIMGGKEIQMRKTKEYLDHYPNISVDFFKLSETDLKAYDIFHNFSLHRECIDLITYAKKCGLKLVISPVYWNSKLVYYDTEGKLKTHLFYTLKKMTTKMGSLYKILNSEKYIIEKADLILPNTKMESDLIQRDFNIDEKLIKVIPNGVDERFLYGNPDLFREKFDIKDDFVLYVGRIDERKNSLRLIKTMEKLEDIKLVIIGSYLDKSYYDKCKNISGENVMFINKLEHDSPLLVSAYAASKVFVLPSWYETPGLSALEAGLSGSNIVITKYGGTHEYFQDFVSYIEPSSVDDMKNKIHNSFYSKTSQKLKTHIKSNYLWENVANKTYLEYEKLL